MNCPIACKQNPPACNGVPSVDFDSISIVTLPDPAPIKKVQELGKKERQPKKRAEQLKSPQKMFFETLHPKGSPFDNPQLIRLQNLESRNEKMIESMNNLREDKRQLMNETEILKNRLKNTQKKLGIVEKEIFGEDNVSCYSKNPSTRSFQDEHRCTSLIAKDQITFEDGDTLTDLAEQFEQALEKVQNHGLCNLANLVKVAASTLKELSKIEEQKCLCDCNCDFTGSNYLELEETFTCNCDEWGPDVLGPSGEWICKNCGEIHYSESDGGWALPKQKSDKKMGIKNSANADKQKNSICICGCGATSVPCDCGCNDTKKKSKLPKVNDKHKASGKPVSTISQMSYSLDCSIDCAISPSQINKKAQEKSKSAFKTPGKSGTSKNQSSFECVCIDLGEIDTRSVNIGVDMAGTPDIWSQCSDNPVDEDEEEGYVMFLKKEKAKIMESKSPTGTVLAHCKSLTKDMQPRLGFEKNWICPHKKDCCRCTKTHDSGNVCPYKSNVSLDDINIEKESELVDVNLLTSCNTKSKYKTLKSTCSYSKIVMSSSSSGEGTKYSKSKDGKSRDKKTDSKPRVKVNEKSLKRLKNTNSPDFSRVKVSNKFPVQRSLECEGQNPCTYCLCEEKHDENYASLPNPLGNSESLCTECWVRETNPTAYPVSQNLEKMCPCGCGLSVDGENETCPCGCGKLAESPRRRDADFAKRTKEIQFLTTECDCEHFGNCELCACPEDFHKVSKDNMVHGSSKSAKGRQLETKLRQDIHAAGKKQKELQDITSRCRYSNKNMENSSDKKCSSLTTIKPTFSGLTTAVEILRAKCRSKDSIIAVLAEELRGSGNVDKIVKNLATPCLNSTAWDFDKCALYNYLTEVKIVKCDKSADSKSANTIPKPSDFKVVREICGCLLLSWKMPKDISRIKGYKIFVNGCFATHVRSPTRTEALLDPVDTSQEFTIKLYAIDIKGNLSDAVTIIYQSSSPGDD